MGRSDSAEPDLPFPVSVRGLSGQRPHPSGHRAIRQRRCQLLIWNKEPEPRCLSLSSQGPRRTVGSMSTELPAELGRAVERLAQERRISPEQALYLVVLLGAQQLERLRGGATLDIFLNSASDQALLYVFEQLWFRHFRDELVHTDPRRFPGGWQDYKRHYKARLELYQKVESAVSHEQSSRMHTRPEDSSLDAAAGALTGVYAPDYLKDLRAEWE